MKRFAAFALVLCIGLFTIGCETPKDKDKKPADKTAVEADADANTDAAKKDGDKDGDKEEKKDKTE